MSLATQAVVLANELLCTTSISSQGLEERGVDVLDECHGGDGWERAVLWGPSLHDLVGRCWMPCQSRTIVVLTTHCLFYPAWFDMQSLLSPCGACTRALLGTPLDWLTGWLRKRFITGAAVLPFHFVLAST